MKKPRTPMSAAANMAARNPATTPAVFVEALALPAAGGSKAPAIVKRMASPMGKPTRDDVPTTPEAKPSSPGRVPVTAAMLIAGNPILAPNAHTSSPGISTKAFPLGDMGVRRMVPTDIRALETRRVRLAPNLLTRRGATQPPTMKKVSAGGNVSRPEERAE